MHYGSRGNRTKCSTSFETNAVLLPPPHILYHIRVFCLLRLLCSSIIIIVSLLYLSSPPCVLPPFLPFSSPHLFLIHHRFIPTLCLLESHLPSSSPSAQWSPFSAISSPASATCWIDHHLVKVSLKLSSPFIEP